MHPVLTPRDRESSRVFHRHSTACLTRINSAAIGSQRRAPLARRNAASLADVQADSTPVRLAKHNFTLSIDFRSFVRSLADLHRTDPAYGWRHLVQPIDPCNGARSQRALVGGLESFFPPPYSPLGTPPSHHAGSGSESSSHAVPRVHSPRHALVCARPSALTLTPPAAQTPSAARCSANRTSPASLPRSAARARSLGSCDTRATAPPPARRSTPGTRPGSHA